MQKDFRLEWRQRAALNGMLLYVGSTVFVCYLSFALRGGQLPAPAWNALFWIILLFTAVNAAAKGFLQESRGRLLYYYTLVRPQAVILAKIAYNAVLLLGLALVGFALYAVVLGNPVQDVPLFVGNVGLGAVGFATTLTLVSGIASKATNSSTLMAVLGFPIMIPMLLLLIKVSKNALDGLEFEASSGSLLTLLALNLIVTAVSYLLFPFLWRG
ncbi:cytochrome C biogenesis protein CcmB [Hymenobacter qilianensis]|uniref:Cytochrome C biogenesis protein CcmB n=2 Tax=Hymenobacter qilianensis TaxID=1385715 RepID=A0ACB5PU63_9BACT|nr:MULTISPECIES: heme exporter protein CcmB [Hymenobacter]MBC6606790.1 heme exporter protein CcmB [Hymenobacter sp. BT188]QNP54013.1 heme exporter protein CcmB [Hymenobacter qilianensis]GGF71904.1 cytochrome C biogenesis protein CcmB [Hymenobacter qilianensis]